jgi:hypothetical protein
VFWHPANAVRNPLDVVFTPVPKMLPLPLRLGVGSVTPLFLMHATNFVSAARIDAPPRKVDPVAPNLPPPANPPAGRPARPRHFSVGRCKADKETVH